MVRSARLLKREWRFKQLNKTLALFAFALFFGKLYAQNFEIDKQKIEELKGRKTFYFKTNPVAYLQGPLSLISDYNAGIEAVATPRTSYQIVAGYLHKSPFFNSAQQNSGSNPREFSFNGYRLQGQFRYYFLKFGDKHNEIEKYSPNGYFLAAHISYLTATLVRKSQSYPANIFENYNINILLGVQSVIKQKAGIEFYLGLGYKQNSIYSIDYRLIKTKINPLASGYSEYYVSNFKFTLGMNLTFGMF